jgi:P pilus assembly chaperone PapD
MLMKKITAAVVLSLTGSFFAYAGPSINVGSMYEYLDSDKSTLIKRIRNNGDATAFVKVDVSEIVFDTSGKSKEVPANSNNVASGKADGMVASPARMIIPVKGMQTNRLLYVGPRDVERYYRVRFLPVAPKDKNEFGQSEAEFKKYTDSISAGVTMLNGFGIVVTVRPKEQRYATDIKDTAAQYVVKNNGNSSIILENIIECDTGTKKCLEPVTNNIRPGQQTIINKDSGKSYKFKLIEGKKTESLSFSR